MDGKKLRSDYHVILEEYRTGHPNIDACLCDILSRGVYNGELCKHGGILISGINPSYDGKAEGELPCNRLTECTGKYWKPYVEIANSFSEDMVGYLDVFPLRCTKEADLLKIVPVDLKVSLIQKFMQVVEVYIRPTLSYTPINLLGICGARMSRIHGWDTNCCRLKRTRGYQPKETYTVLLVDRIRQRVYILKRHAINALWLAVTSSLPISISTPRKD